MKDHSKKQRYQPYYERLKRAVIAELKGNPELDLSESDLYDLEEFTDVKFSTLRRIFGFDDQGPDYLPHTSNLEKLIQWLELGIRGWNEFIKWCDTDMDQGLHSQQRSKDDHPQREKNGVFPSKLRHPIFGREKDIEKIVNILKPAKENPSQNILVIRGWPGVGKTSISTAIAHDPRLQAHFTDGLLWVSLGTNPNIFEVLSHWAEGLGLDGPLQSETLEGAKTRMRKFLEDKRCLIIVDDVWFPEHFQALCLGGATCKMLVTTRIPDVASHVTNQTGEIYNLAVLPPQSSFDLLSYLIPDIVAKFPAESRLLVAELEGLPLSIHVAGRLLRAENEYGLDVGSLLVELRDSIEILKSKAPIDRVDSETGKLHSVEIILRKSTECLSRLRQEQFAMLGVFAPKPARFTMEAISAVLAISNPRPIVRNLAERGLLENLGNGEYQMHSLLAAHARHLLESNSE